MALTTWQVLLVAVIGLLAARAPGAAARKQKSSQPTNTTFPSCNTGTSRIVLANLDKLSADCRPAHNHVAAAIYACFATSKVKVEDCQVTIHPAGKAAKISPICKVVHAQGVLQGPSNASLVGIINQAKLTKFVTEHPDMAGSADAAATQKLCASTLAQLFGRAVLLQGKHKCSKASGTGHTAKDTKGPKNHNNSGADAPASALDGVVPGRRRPGHRKKGAGTAATAATAAADDTVDAPAAPAAAAVPNAGNSTAAAGSNITAVATPDAAAGNSSTASGGNSSSTITADANFTSANESSAAVLPAAAAAGASAQPGRRKLLFDIGERELHQQLSRHLLDNSTKATVAAVAAAVADQACTDDAAYDADADFRAALSNSSSSTGNLEGSVLYRQGTDDVILQPSQQCRFQYVVPKNPNLLQPTGKPSIRAAAAAPATAAAAAARKASAGPGAGAAGAGSVTEAGKFGHVAWIVFSSVSAVLGVAVVFMLVKLVVRRSDFKRYDALQTSEPVAMAVTNNGTVQLVPTTAGSDQRDQQQRPDSAGVKAAAAAGHELSDTATRGDKTRPLKDNRKSDGTTATGK